MNNVIPASVARRSSMCLRDQDTIAGTAESIIFHFLNLVIGLYAVSAVAITSMYPGMRTRR